MIRLVLLAFGCAFTFCGSINIISAATVTTFAGTGVKGYSGDGGPATKAQLNNVFAVARGPDGYLYLCDMDNARVRRVGTNGVIETFAGSGVKGHGGDGGPATHAALNQPYELAWDKAGNLFIVELGNHDVRRVDVNTGVITTIAGTGKAGFSGDGGPAIAAELNQPHSLAFDAHGDLYICDILNHRIRKIEMRSGVISTWSGTGEKKTAPDGSSVMGAALHGPRAMAFAPDGKCYLALREGNLLLLLDPQANTLKRVAGTGKKGFTGNGGRALEATLSGPKCVSLAPNGNVYLADTETHSIRYLDVQKQTLEVLVGDGTLGDGPDGNEPLRCRLARPHGVFVDRDGAVFIGDSETHRVRVWRP
jgi:streptogramin lyase